jgi:ubiquinone/menaquinone biosynthesis C-methylase UbiE
MNCGEWKIRPIRARPPAPDWPCDEANGRKENQVSIQERITGFWSAVADGYEDHAGNVPGFGSAEHQAWERLIDDVLPSPPADVLDVATGTGFLALIAAARGHRVTGIDLADPMLSVARRTAEARGLVVSFIRADAVAPDLPSLSFDAVTSRHLLWTLRDPKAALVAWLELLRPGGRMVIIDGFWFDPDSEPEEGFFESFYDRDTRHCLPGWTYRDVRPIIAMVEAAGFVDARAIPLEDIHRLAEHPASERPPYVVTARRSA